MEQHDVIIAGGHNGLTAAAYLAKAGLDVLLLEGKDKLGGGVVTREVTVPGFRHDLHAIAHIFIQGNPMIRDDELGLLARHGLQYVFPDPSIAVTFPDGDYLAFYRDVHRPPRPSPGSRRVTPRTTCASTSSPTGCSTSSWPACSRRRRRSARSSSSSTRPRPVRRCCAC